MKPTRAPASSDRQGSAPDSDQDRGSQWLYWQFYWPLLLMSISMVVARQFQNATLARYPGATRQIAIFAYASSVYWMIMAILAFVPQVSNALGRSSPSRRVCLGFTTLVCILLTALLATLSYTDAGHWMLLAVMGIRKGDLPEVVRYLRLFCPMVLLHGLRQHYTGLLVQARRTGIVAALNIVHVPMVAGMLVLGFFLMWGAILTIVLSQLIPLAVQLLAAWICFRLAYRKPIEPEQAPVSWRKVTHFFWPVALTGLMFSLTRPIVYAYVNRTEDPRSIVAALRVGFDLSMLFQMASNQFRHLFVTFGQKHLKDLRGFATRVVICVTAIMLVVALTPLKTVFFENILGLEQDVARMAGQILLVMCAVPAVIAWRNYYHGIALIHHRTVGMGIGGLSRNATAWLLCSALLAAGWLNHWTAAFILVCAFTAEALTVIISTRGWRSEVQPGAAGPAGNQRNQAL